MKAIERFNLVDKVARELQARMTYEDIDVYLVTAGVVKVKLKHTSYGSKWVYAKELLSEAPEESIIRIADELGIPHSYTVVGSGSLTESKFWELNHFRLFLSHLSSFKVTTAALRNSLRRFAISGFVAHEDIAPAKQWQNEIEAALFSMDALVVLVTPNFVESEWADQEVGIAIGRESLVIPVMRDAIPHGFIGKFQGVNGKGKSVPQVANELFEVLIGSSQTKNRLLTCLVDTTVLELNEAAAMAKLKALISVATIPSTFLERLRDGAARSDIFQRSTKLSFELKTFLQARGIELTSTQRTEAVTDEDIPF
jgi:TIR domain